jgi:hypothetical protein
MVTPLRHLVEVSPNSCGNPALRAKKAIITILLDDFPCNTAGLYKPITRRHPTPNAWSRTPVTNISFDTCPGRLGIVFNSVDNLLLYTILPLKMSPSLYLSTLFGSFIKRIVSLTGGTESISIGLTVNRVEVLLCQEPTLVDCVQVFWCIQPVCQSIVINSTLRFAPLLDETL